MALAGLLTSASMSSCSGGNENEEPRPLADTEQSVAEPVKDMIVDSTPAADASADEKPPIASKNWYELNVSNRLSIPPKWYDLYKVDIEDYKDAVSDDSDKPYVPSKASLTETTANNSEAKPTERARKDVSKKRSQNLSLVYGPIAYQGPKPIGRWLATKTQVTGGRDRLAVIEVIRPYVSNIQACYVVEFNRDKNVGSGKVTVSWNIDEAGTVSGVTIEATALHNKRVEDCIVATIKRYKFPPAKGVDSTHVKTVFDFSLR